MVVVSTSTIERTITCTECGALSSLGLRQSVDFVRATKNLFLQLDLLTELLSSSSTADCAVSTVCHAATLEQLISIGSRVLSTQRLSCHIVEQHKGWIHLCLLVKSFVQEANSFVILFLQFALDALILDELQLFLFLRDSNSAVWNNLVFS